MLERLEHRINIQDALDWTLYNECLLQALIDEAEGIIDETRPGFIEEEIKTEVKVDGDDFVITFVLGEEE